jgi:hypothetical protein
LARRSGGESPFEALLVVPVETASMGLDRETIAQVLVSITAVVLFIAGLVVLSISYGTEVAGLIAAFIVIMPVFGYMIERQDFDGE